MFSLNTKIISLLLGLSTIIHFEVLTQISVNTQGAATLVNDVLLGNGITATNITFNGDPLQLGYFDGSATNLDMNAGVVMSTGDVNGLVPGTFENFITNFSSDNDLLTIANSVPPLIGQSFSVSSTNDVAILEFDFVPVSDSIEFQYVFGSQEYYGYENTSYNDVFAFLISGPGISGPYNAPAGFPDGAANIAVIPNSSPPLPITISSVNASINSSYFVDNTSLTTVDVIDGFTIPIKAQAQVQCGETYHIKLAIADGSDGGYSSCIFLEAGSFSSTGLSFSSQVNYTHPSLNPNSVYEGCGGMTITIERVETIDTDTIRFSKAGTAIAGIDYTNFPDSVVFDIGEAIQTISFDVMSDNIEEEEETIQLILEAQLTSCGNLLSDTIVLTIVEPPILEAEVPDINAGCSTDPQTLVANVTSGLSDFTYIWSNGSSGTESDSTIEVTVPASNQTYTVTITDACNVHTTEASGSIIVPGADISLSVNDTIACKNSITTINPVTSGGTEPYNYWWENTSGLSGNGLDVDVESGDHYTLYATDFCNYDTANTNFNILVYNPIYINPLPDVFVNCPDEEITQSFLATGGTGNYIYTWDNWGHINEPLEDVPASSTVYTLQVTDDCEADTAQTIFSAIVASYFPVLLLYEDELVACKGTAHNLEVQAFGGRGNYKYVWYHTSSDTNSINYTVQEDDTVRLDIIDECNIVSSAFFNIDSKQPEANFTAFYFDVNDIEFQNKSSKDAIEYFWDFGDGNTSKDFEPAHGYVRSGIYNPKLVVRDDLGCKDSIVQEVRSPGIVWVPSSFTPNGDRVNDTWRPVQNGINNYDLKVYDRWGSIVFEAGKNEQNKEWDGKNASPGLYHYKLVGKSMYTNEDIEERGSLYLIR